MTAVGGSGRDRAIEAAAAAIERIYSDTADDWDPYLRRLAVDALEAALPVLLNDLADSIEARADPDAFAYRTPSIRAGACGYNDGLSLAVSLVRAAAAGWGTE